MFHSAYPVIRIDVFFFHFSPALIVPQKSTKIICNFAAVAATTTRAAVSPELHYTSGNQSR